MQLSIIIVNYNVKYFLEHCLLSVIKACDGLEREIFVVDNNSTDGSKPYLEPKFPSVNFIWGKENVGFGKANNIALKKATGDNILFLNPDTIVPEDCFINCLRFFDAHADCGALGVRMIDGSGLFLKESKRCLPTAGSGLYKMIGLTQAFPNSKTFGKYYAGHLPEKQRNKVQILAGAFMMLSKKAIEITKGFDEDFFMYGEDIDLSYRVIKAGLFNYYLGDTTIVHFKGESTQKKSSFYVDHFYGAMKMFVDKHYSENFTKRRLMQFAINTGKQIIKLKNLIAKEDVKLNRGSFNVLVVGKENQILDVQNIFLENNIPISKISIDENNITIEDISEFALNKKISEMILCEGKINYSFIINALQKAGDHFLILFYADGASSIIGSNDKNTQGVFITAHQ